MLLIVTNKTDLACDYLILRLRERGARFVRMNTEDFGIQFTTDIFLTDGAAGFRIHFDGRPSLRGDDIKGVYFRQALAPSLPDVIDEDAAFVKRECMEVLRSLWRIIPSDRWINHPRYLWLANNKVEQLSLAPAMGFRVPDTLVTNSKSEVRRFFALHSGRLICKAVKHGFVHADGTVRFATTQRIDEAFLDNFDTFAPVPMIYQPELDKTVDVRVTVVGAEAFATAIHSQEHVETEVDWRLSDIERFDLRHEKIELPPAVRDACIRMTGHFHLRYSAIDLVLDTDGHFSFLELNPNGQWAWIEQRVGYPIRDALIDLLVGTP